MNRIYFTIYCGVFCIITILNLSLTNGSSVSSSVYLKLPENIVVSKIPTFNNRTSNNWSPILTDIAQHIEDSRYGFSTYYEPSSMSTSAHEITHGINSYIRNNLNTTKEKVNGFYLLNGEALILKEPNITKSQVSQYVPTSLRNLDITKRYNTYIVGQRSWDDSPLYIFDEWIAYIHGAQEAVELYKLNKFKDDAVDLSAGAVEFMVYASSLVKAVYNHDKNYLNDNDQFKNFYKFLVEQTLSVYKEALKIPTFVSNDQKNYYNNFMSSSTNEIYTLKETLKTVVGTNWVNSHLQ